MTRGLRLATLKMSNIPLTCSMKDRIMFEGPMRQANIQRQTSRSRDRLKSSMNNAFSSMDPNQNHQHMITTANIQASIQNYQILLHS